MNGSLFLFKYFRSYREWRISHALSHHLYPNTLHDLEISYFEPFLNWIPSPNLKQGASKYLAWLITPIAYGLIYFMELTKRLVVALSDSKRPHFYWDDIVVPFSIPVVMLFFNNFDVFKTIKLWILILWMGGFAFGVIGLNAAHHHPEINHEGDAHK